MEMTNGKYDNVVHLFVLFQNQIKITNYYKLVRSIYVESIGKSVRILSADIIILISIEV